MVKARDYRVEKTEIEGTRLSVTSYQIGEQFYCTVSNEDPGATLARAQGANREQAKQAALQKARRYLQKK